MRRRSVLAGALAAAGAGAAWRLRRRGPEHVELHYADGSMVRLEAGTTAADDLLALTRRALRQAGVA
jgi:hypothetical protein